MNNSSNLNQQPFSGLQQASFKSFDELKNFIRNYEAENFLQMIIAASRTIEGARNRGYKSYVNSDLKYTEITYRCIHFGHRKSRSTGKRPNQSTYRQHCPCFIRLRANGEKLIVADYNEEHNHPCNKETNAFLPHQRILDEATKDYAKKILKLRPNKKLFLEELQKETNKNITLQDLHNLPSADHAEESLETTVKYLRSKEGSTTVELVQNEENTLLAIFFQDNDMQRLFNSYPEIVFVDAIHKVCDRRMPLYILLVEDGNGDSEIVGFYLVMNEEEDTMEQLPYLLKKHNSAWENTRSVMTDKDVVEMEVFRDAFPQAKLTYGNKTKRLEAINSKVVQVLKRNSKLLDLFKDLDKLLISLRMERNVKAAKVQLKVPIIQDDIDEAQRQYMQHLTPYAYGLVAEQYRLTEEVKVVKNDDKFSVQSQEGLLDVHPNSCSCSFFKCVQLPCRHVLKVRKMENHSSFSENLCATRWNKKYYTKNSCVVAHDIEVPITQSKSGIKTLKSKKILSQFEKFSVTSRRTARLASLASEAPSRLFKQRLDVINFIIDKWENGKEVTATEVQEIGNDMEETTESSPENEVNKASQPGFTTMVETTEAVVPENEADKPSSSRHLTIEEASELYEEKFGEKDEMEGICTEFPSVLALTDGSDNLPVLPPKIKKRGRPKGAEMTVIGLPSKKRRSHRVV